MHKKKKQLRKKCRLVGEAECRIQVPATMYTGTQGMDRQYVPVDVCTRPVDPGLQHPVGPTRFKTGEC